MELQRAQGDKLPRDIFFTPQERVEGWRGRNGWRKPDALIEAIDEEVMQNARWAAGGRGDCDWDVEAFRAAAKQRHVEVNTFEFDDDDNLLPFPEASLGFGDDDGLVREAVEAIIGA